MSSARGSDPTSTAVHGNSDLEVDGELLKDAPWRALLQSTASVHGDNRHTVDAPQSLTEMAEEAIRQESEHEVASNGNNAENEEEEDAEEEEEEEDAEEEERNGPVLSDIDHDGNDQSPERRDGEESLHDEDAIEHGNEGMTDGSDGSNNGDAEEGDQLVGEDDLPRRLRRLSLEDVLHAKAVEESRVIQEMEAHTEKEDHESRGGDDLKQTEAEDSDVEEPTAFGLPQVVLPDRNQPARRASLTSTLKLAATLAKDYVTPRRLSSQAVRPMDGPQAMAVEASRQKVWHAMWETVWVLLVLLDALYVFLSVPLRIGFLYDPWDNRYHRHDRLWTDQLTFLTALDVAGELCRWKFTYRIVKKVFERRTRVRAASNAWLPRKLTATGSLLQVKSALVGRQIRGSLFSVRSEQTLTASAPDTQSFDAMRSLDGVADAGDMNIASPPMVLLVIGIFPLELAAVFTNYNWLHIARSGKLLLVGYSLVASYSALLLRVRGFAWAQWLSFSTLATPFYLFWLGLYLCHLSACGYMLIANVECGLQSQYCVKTPIPGSWVLKDNMERATLWRQYVRSMYWASKTITTLGQGDLVPATQMETNYCIVVQFISGLWATAFLASCSFYFSRRDRDIENGVSTRLEQALRFLRSRKVPSTLAIQIRNYYQHIQRTRNGIEEDRVLANLPAHYQFQCAFFVKYRLLSKVPFLSKQSKAFLRTVVNALDSDFHSPKETVLALFDVEELIVVARGEISVLDQQKELVHVLSQEDWFAEDALFDEQRSQFELEAKTFCEIFRLSRPVFLSCMEKHFTKLRIAAVISQQKRRPAMASPRAAQATRPTPCMTRPHSTRSSFFKTLSQRNAFESLPWQHPKSNFRKHWRRWKAVFLLFLAVEVPYEIAFKWRRGVIDDAATTSERSVYLLSIVTEVFFYVDWYFRAFKFARRDRSSQSAEVTPDREDTQRSIRADMSSTGPRKRDDLITKPRAILQQYLASDDVYFDALATLPISMIWNLVNRTSYSIVVRELMRFARLLAVGRVFALKPIMRRIMVEFDFSPASHLLANVVVFCIITANAMACYFYLLADDKSFVDALPVGFDPRTTPVSGAQCLEQATLYGNCTWYIYDRSTYPVEARYIRAMHWSLVLLSTVGYGDVLSFSNSECLIGFWWIFLGALICYFTSCAVGSVISQVTVLRSTQDARVEEITRALVRSNVSKATRAMVRCHYEANWELNGSVVSEDGLMQRLPRSLRHQLSSSLYVHSLRRCYIFAGFGGQLNLIREVALAMTSMIVLPRFPIVEGGHVSTQMYLVQSGEAEMLLPLRLRGGSVVAGMKKDTSLLMHQQRQRQRQWWNILAKLRRWLRGLFSSDSNDGSSFSESAPSGSAAASAFLLRGDRYRLRDVPIAVLRDGDCFGEEGLLPQERFALHATVRALTSTQVAVLHRDAFLGLSDRFPGQLGQMIALIAKRHDDNRELHNTIRGNLERKDKVRDFLGSCVSVYVEVKSLVNGIITPNRDFYRIWHALHGLVLTYNFYQITFRLAFVSDPSPSTMTTLCIVDYLIDAFLYADIYLKWNRFGYEQYGENVTSLHQIRRRYKKGWFKIDCLSMLPTYYYGDYFYMTLARVPRLLKSPQLLEHIDAIESAIRDKFMKGSTTLLSVFDLFKFFLFFLSAAHHIGSVYFLLGRVLTSHKFVSTSWMTADFVINIYPGDILVQYNRAVYWCLETFTVVCFGDVVSRNALETVYASMTCIIGWMCIGQVVGRITSLMASIDKDMKEHNERVDYFEQFARNRKLPAFLRERAIESVEYKSKCLIELNMQSIFQDLPQALHVILFHELHGNIIRAVPDFAEACTASQIRVLANAFVLEIYVADDILIEEGRLGTKLFVMKEGRAEHFSAHSRMVFAAVHEGVLFGDLAFFLSGTRQIASVRASRSCQVLCLDRTAWQSLWSDTTRQQLEAKIAPVMRNKYRSVSRAFLNIVKNFEVSIHSGPKPSNAVGSPAIMDLGLLAGAGASTRSIQSSNASRGGESSGGKLSENSNPHAADHHQTHSTHKDAHWLGCFGRRRGKVVPALAVALNPLSAKRRRRSKKRSVPSGGNYRKLSAVLGIDVTVQPTNIDEVLTQDETSEFQWKRHERNLRVLQFIDHRIHEDDRALEQKTRHSGNLDRQEPDHDSVDDEAGSPQPTEALALQTPPAASSHSPSVLVPPTNGHSTTHPSGVKPGSPKKGEMLPRQSTGIGTVSTAPTRLGKRHSIQVDQTDLKQAFRAVLDDRATTKEQRQPQPNHKPLHGNANGNGDSSTHKAPQRDTFGVSPGLQSSGSSSRSVGSVDAPKSSYAQHLDALKLRSQRRQRRSVFTVITNGVDDQVDETKNPYEIWLEPPLPPAFCLENSPFRRRWNAVMYGICLYYILIVPFRVSFDFEYLSSPDTTTMTALWFVCEYVMDLLCVVDFVLHKNYFTFVHRGTLVTDKHAIRAHYLRNGTYMVDLLCIAPLELLIPLVPFLRDAPVGAVVVGVHAKFSWYRIAVFRLNKMLRIVHLHSLGDKIQRMLVYDVTSLSFVRPSMVYFVRFSFDFALGAHWVACLFFGVAFNTFQPGVPSWLTTAGMLTFEGIQTEQEIGHVHWLMKYSRAYHFSMGAITTVSYGDIAPQNAWETFVGTFVIVISIVLFGMLSGGFSQVYEMELGKRADYEEKIASVAHYMMFHRFPARIWKHMQSYFLVHWKESQGMNEEELLSGLPLSVKHDITLFVKQDFVKQMRLFAGCDEAFVRAVVVAFDQELFVRNDVMITYGERGRRSLYVIESGHVLVRVPKKLTAETPKLSGAAAKTSAAAGAAFSFVSAAKAHATAKANVESAFSVNTGAMPHHPGPSSPLLSPMRPAPSAAAARLTFSQGADIEIIKGRFDFFGEKSLIFDVPRSATCIALSSCSMLILTLEKYEEILLEFPEYREKNMREWIFANARENTPAAAIRSPNRLLAKIKSRKSVRANKESIPAAAAVTVAAGETPSGPLLPPPLPPPPSLPSSPPLLPPHAFVE